MKSVIHAVSFAVLAAAADEKWEDSDSLSSIFSAIHDKDDRRVDLLLVSEPTLGFARSSDGRGAAWWAWEFGNVHALATLSATGVDVFNQGKDIFDLAPTEMCTAKNNCDVERLSKDVKKGVAAAKHNLAEIKKQLETDAEVDFEDEEGEQVGANKIRDVLPEEGNEVDDEL